MREAHKDSRAAKITARDGRQGLGINTNQDFAVALPDRNRFPPQRVEPTGDGLIITLAGTLLRSRLGGAQLKHRTVGIVFDSNFTISQGLQVPLIVQPPGILPEQRLNSAPHRAAKLPTRGVATRRARFDDGGRFRRGNAGLHIVLHEQLVKRTGITVCMLASGGRNAVPQGGCKSMIPLLFHHSLYTMMNLKQLSVLSDHKSSLLERPCPHHSIDPTRTSYSSFPPSEVRNVSPFFSSLCRLTISSTHRGKTCFYDVSP